MGRLCSSSLKIFSIKSDGLGASGCLLSALVGLPQTNVLAPTPSPPHKNVQSEVTNGEVDRHLGFCVLSFSVFPG